jgi:competence protein ComEC
MAAPVATAAAVTLAATLGTAPLMAAHFGRVSLASLPANLLAAPAVAPVMWLGMLAAAAAQVDPSLAEPFTALAAPLLALITTIAHAAASAPLAVLPLHLASPGAIAAVYAGLAAVGGAFAGWVRRTGPVEAVPGAGSGVFRRVGAALAGGRARLRRGRVAALLAALVLTIVVAAGTGPGAGAAPAAGELVVSFLDVGQGDATLLRRDGASVLVDTGPPDGPIVRRLREEGVRRLDALLLTHAQLDHEGAALSVMRAFAPRVVVDGGAGWPSAVQRALPVALRAARARELVPAAGEVVTIGGIRLRMLWPPRAPPALRLAGDPNQRAVVALAEAAGVRLLLTADAEGDVTGPLRIPPVDMLKVAHHGSADPGLPALLARLRPRVAAIEVGRHNPYGHPALSTLAALRAVPHVFRTDRDGTVRLHVRDGRIRVELRRH